VLNQRLTELRDAGVVETGPQGYRLTETGAELLKALAPLDAWAKRWGAADAGAQARRGRGSVKKCAAGR
jgi:DNA-binding HxlR family transcriptional regulator